MQINQVANKPVDAVITWVDGNDSVHAEKLAHYFATKGIVRPKSAAPTRFNECGEIDYCVKSLLHFAPWIRNIFIVTDAQTPPIIQTLAGTPFADKITVIDHRDIFFGFENSLPTFNSLSIESLLWRIKGLSEEFIYLNDDCALIRPLTYEDFFRDQRLVLRGYWKTQFEKKWRYRLKKYSARLLNKSPPPIEENEHRTMQEKSAQLVGWDRHFFHLPHAPFPIKKTTLENFFLQHPDQLSKNAHFPLRDPQQFWPISLAYHLDIKNKNVIFDNSLKAIYLNAACHPLKKIQQRLAQVENNPNIAFICMQSLDSATPSTRAMLLKWLDQRIF